MHGGFWWHTLTALTDNSTSTHTVTGGNAAFSNQSHLFSFASVPQVNLGNRTTNVIGGVMLGGSSGVNGFQVHRGQKEDYDGWGSRFGNSSGWSWDGLLPYFKKVGEYLSLLL
jgi:choline dehydrogenase